MPAPKPPCEASPQRLLLVIQTNCWPDLDPGPFFSDPTLNHMVACPAQPLPVHDLRARVHIVVQLQGQQVTQGELLVHHKRLASGLCVRIGR
jgi:hypothetical protein